MKYALWFLGFVCIVSHTHAAQYDLTPLEITHLDSLMARGEFSAVRTFIDSVQNNESTAGQMTPYLHIIEHINTIITTKSLDHLKQRLEQSRVVAQQFKHRRAIELYQKSLQAQKNGAYDRAFKWYTLAYFFDSQAKRRRIANIREVVQLGYELLHRNQLDSARIFVDTVSFTADRNIRLQALADSLNLLQYELKQRLDQKERQDWSLDIPVNPRIALLAGGSLCVRNPVSNADLTLHSKGDYPDEPLTGVTLPAGIGAGLQARLNTYWLGRLILGTELSCSSLSYHNQNDQELVALQFDVKRIQAHVYVSYLFRNTTRIRPFAGIGAGFLIAERHPTDVTALTERRIEDEIVQTIKHFAIDKETLQTPRGLVQFGFEYIPRNMHSLMIRSHVALYYNAKHNDFIRPLDFSIGMAVGVVF
jgi:hypothetical protein